MLHLLPLRSIVRIALGVTVLAVMVVFIFGQSTTGSGFTTATSVLRWVLGAEAILAILIYYLWHRLPGLTARWLFPHIDGSWDGSLQFVLPDDVADGEAAEKTGRREANLHVHQTLVNIRLILETDESTSETLVVHAGRDPDFSRFRLFYIFENKSRDGLPNTARSYRGTAVMEVPPGRPDELRGTYFTDQGSEGTFLFERRAPEKKGLKGLWAKAFGQKGAATPIRPNRDEAGRLPAAGSE